MKTNTTMKVVLIYRPPGGNIGRFLNMLYNEILPITLENDTLLIGDFNLPGNLALKSFLEESGLKQLIEVPTHLAGNILDLVITNQPTKIQEIFVSDFVASDHKMITFDIKLNTEVSKDRVRKYNWAKTDWECFCYSLENSLGLNTHIDNPSVAAEFLVDSIKANVDEFVPVVERNFKLRICPFFDETLETLKRERRKCERLYRKKSHRTQ